MLLLVVGCSDGSSSKGDGGGSTDPFAALKDVSASKPIHCDGDRCCFWRCAYVGDAEHTYCVSRAAEDLRPIITNMSTITKTGHQPYKDCEQVLFPEWFYANDCFLWAWTPPFDNVGQVVIQCFCGRTSTSFSGEWSASSGWASLSTCDLRDQPEPDWTKDIAAKCTKSNEACKTAQCKPRCTGRVCGPNGCGGSCGNCSGGTCNAAGQCGSSGGTTCSGCLSSCKGLSGCCTGCGCICESACYGENPYGC
jgi:hypothetical protein